MNRSDRIRREDGRCLRIPRQRGLHADDLRDDAEVVGHSVTNYIRLEGAIPGKVAAPEIMQLIEGDVMWLVDRRAGSSRMAEAR